MLKSYFITAARIFSRNKGVSLIKLFGLAVGLASCLICALYIKNDVTTNQHLADIEKIYRITVKFKVYDLTGTPYLLTETLAKDYPEVEGGVRVSEATVPIKIQDQVVRHKALMVDPDFLSFFSQRLRLGDERTALGKLKNLVISEKIATQYFGNADPIGKTVAIKVHTDYEPFEITGVVMRDARPSSLEFDFLMPLDNRFVGGPRGRDSWTNFMFTSFVKVKPEKLEGLKEKMPDFVDRHIRASDPDVGNLDFTFNPLAKHHLASGAPGSGLKPGINASNLYVFGGIALAILLLATFNFMNLSNAQTSRRASEVGVRKVVGAVRGQLIRQYLAETFLLAIVGAFLSLGLAELSLLGFKDMLGVELSVFQLQNADVFIVLMVITALTGIAAGIYPALVLSNMNALKTFKKNIRVGGNNWLTRSVLTFQFGLSIVLMVGSIAMWKQQDYLSAKDLGFNQEQLLVLPFGLADSLAVDRIKADLEKNATVVSVSNTSGSFTRGNAVTMGKGPDNADIFVYLQSIDEKYIPTMQMQLVQGRNFTQEDAADPSRIIVNEKFIRDFNLQDSIGVKLGISIGRLDAPTVIGVVRDFNHSSLQHEIGPMLMTYNERFESTYLMVRMQAGKIQQCLSAARQIWQTHNPASPFDFYFLDEDLAKQYEADLRWSRIITVATVMAIFLSVLGLVGLAVFTAERRKKEIGIRKVLGASVSQLLRLLSTDYLVVIAISFVIAAPISYYVLNEYVLSRFVYHIDIGISMYAAALVLMLVIAIAAVASQTLRAALQNPTDVLKEE